MFSRCLGSNELRFVGRRLDGVLAFAEPLDRGRHHIRLLRVSRRDLRGSASVSENHLDAEGINHVGGSIHVGQHNRKSISRSSRVSRRAARNRAC